LHVEGRDKLTKLLQYLAKFLSWYFQNTDSAKGVIYLQLSGNTQILIYNCSYTEKLRDARSLFRLLKFIFEIKRIQIIASCSQDMFSLITNISSRAFYLLYWICDNVYVIFKYMGIQSELLPKERWRSLARIFWFLGLSMFLIYCIKTLRKTYTDESDLKVAALNKMTVK
jgi:hypothetical protein